MLLQAPDGPLWRFDPGALFLEFMLTGGPGELARFDVLRSPADLDRWCGSSRLALHSGAVHATSRDIPGARAVRDALWRLTWQRMRAEPAGAADLGVVNRAAARPALAPQLGPTGEAGWLLPATASAVLATVARDAIGALAGPNAGRLRECEAGDCQLVFLDTSRPGTRRWCSMERCGNRHKVRALRTRRTPPIPKELSP